MDFKIEIIVPDKIFCQLEIMMATIPCIEGEIGVLKDHIAFMSALKPGVIKLYKNEKEILKEIFVSGGFVEVLPDNTVILADDAIDIKAINIKEIKEKLSADQKALDNLVDEVEIKNLQKKIDISEAILNYLY